MTYPDSLRSLILRNQTLGKILHASLARSRSAERSKAADSSAVAGLLALAASPFAALAATDTGEGVSFADGPRVLVRYPGKRPLIRVHTRPPHLETPFSVFNEGPITANDAFFVRYHLANIPLAVDLETYRLNVKGTVGTPLSLSLAELKAIAEPVEVVAVNQCSGNSRGFSSTAGVRRAAGQRCDGQRALDRRALAQGARKGGRRRGTRSRSRSTGSTHRCCRRRRIFARRSTSSMR